MWEGRHEIKTLAQEVELQVGTLLSVLVTSSFFSTQVFSAALFNTCPQDSAGQDVLFQWVHGVEREMNRSGVPVINPRKQPFHCTMALVDTHRYPVGAALAAVARAVPLFSTVTFDQFFVDGVQIKPHGTK